MSYPEFKGALAAGLVGLGQLDDALAAVNEGLDDVVQFEHGHDLFFAECCESRAKSFCDEIP